MKHALARIVVVTLFAALELAIPAAASARSFSVTSSRDAGRGSLREAIAAANADHRIDRIEISRRVGTIVLTSSLVYSGTQRLTIDGTCGSRITGGDFDLLVANGGASSISLRDLALLDGGEAGLVIDVPATATGTIVVSLHHVLVRGMGAEGVRVDERSDGVGGGATSVASIRLRVKDSVIEGNGDSPVLDDVDAIRVDEGGVGDIVARIYRSRIEGNFFDGVELDEQGDGSVDAMLGFVSLDGNGEGNAVLNEPDDGFDVDEADAGDVSVSVWFASVNGNFDQGLDLDEAGDGSATLAMTYTEASANGSEGAKLSESGLGNATITANRVTFDSNGDDGFQFEEADAGDISLVASRLTSDHNIKDGVKVDETGDGSLHLSLSHAEMIGNHDDGMQLSEANAGDLAATLTDVVSRGNTSKGLKAKQASSGTGAMTTDATVLVDTNGTGQLDLSGVAQTIL